MRQAVLHRTRASAAFKHCAPWPWSTAQRPAQPAGERSAEEQNSARAARQRRTPPSFYRMCVRICGFRRPSSCPTSPWRSLSSRLAGEPSSGARGVSCCLSTSLSPGSVSAQSTPHPSTLARLPCAHPRAETHSDPYLLTQRSCVRSHAPSVQQIDARAFGKVKRQMARRHGIKTNNQIPRGWHGSRGR